MENIFLPAFITGLTTGGISCMLVQGGLVAGSLADRIEKEQWEKGNNRGKRKRLAVPILLFLTSKLVAYTLLGFLLGAIGSVLSLSSTTRGIMQIAIAVFMIGNGLRMLNVHPIFRYFSFEPPAFITRYIRRRSKAKDSALTPLFLGALTVFIPCGVTQSMMALAIASGSPVTGAVIMFAFTLGASPVFFALTYLATALGSLAEKYFTRIAAVALLLFGVITLEIRVEPDRLALYAFRHPGGSHARFPACRARWLLEQASARTRRDRRRIPTPRRRLPAARTWSPSTRRTMATAPRS